MQLTATGRTDLEAELLLEESQGNRRAARHAIFSFPGESVEEVVGLKLAVGGYTIGVAESCTGGLIAQRLTEVPGSSQYFIEGVVAIPTMRRHEHWVLSQCCCWKMER